MFSVALLNIMPRRRAAFIFLNREKQQTSVQLLHFAAMADLIRRQSMEHLEVYDLDKILPKPSVDHQLPPPLPPPRQCHRRASLNVNSSRYQFLCSTKRTRTDPIYSATPMFTTIPSTPTSDRQLLGSSTRLRNVTPLLIKALELTNSSKEEQIFPEEEIDFQDEKKLPASSHSEKQSNGHRLEDDA